MIQVFFVTKCSAILIMNNSFVKNLLENKLKKQEKDASN